MLIEILQVSVTDRTTGYIRGKDSEGRPLRHAFGHNVYLFADTQADDETLNQLVAKFPAAFRADVKVPRDQLAVLRRLPSPLLVVVAKIELAEKRKAQSPNPKADSENGKGNGGEPPKKVELPDGWQELPWPELQQLAKTNGIAANQSKPDVIAALTKLVEQQPE